MKAAIVLAGGAGSRLGVGPPKALRPFAGTTLLDIAVGRARAWADEVRVSAPIGMELPVPEKFVLRDIAAFGPRAGPLIALGSSLERVPSPWVLALAVDLPFAQSELFDLLWAARERPATADPLVPAHHEPLAVVPWTARGPEPLVAVYRRQVAAVFLAAAKDRERAVHRVLASLPTVRIDEAELRSVDPDLDSLRNVNTQEEWSRAEDDYLSR